MVKFILNLILTFFCCLLFAQDKIGQGVLLFFVGCFLIAIIRTLLEMGGNNY